jgi:hypothetical protein
VQLGTALGAADDERILADVVVDEGPQAHAQSPGHLEQGTDGWIDVVVQEALKKGQVQAGASGQFRDVQVPIRQHLFDALADVQGFHRLISIGRKLRVAK